MAASFSEFDPLVRVGLIDRDDFRHFRITAEAALEHLAIQTRLELGLQPGSVVTRDHDSDCARITAKSQLSSSRNRRGACATKKSAVSGLAHGEVTLTRFFAAGTATKCVRNRAIIW